MRKITHLLNIYYSKECRDCPLIKLSINSSDYK